MHKRRDRGISAKRDAAAHAASGTMQARSNGVAPTCNQLAARAATPRRWWRRSKSVEGATESELATGAHERWRSLCGQRAMLVMSGERKGSGRIRVESGEEGGWIYGQEEDGSRRCSSSGGGGEKRSREV
ncbi:hypothetical protein L1887_54814 [Cichorium endivia]|nr:hypothetical protein L1887_54814 [Cichorium endivia]